jgi:hypothetical protein
MKSKTRENKRPLLSNQRVKNRIKCQIEVFKALISKYELMKKTQETQTIISKYKKCIEKRENAIKYLDSNKDIGVTKLYRMFKISNFKR